MVFDKWNRPAIMTELSYEKEQSEIRQVHGVAVDQAFLIEMSNLSPPIIYPPPSTLSNAPLE
jgi:hypothetical protein